MVGRDVSSQEGKLLSNLNALKWRPDDLAACYNATTIRHNIFLVSIVEIKEIKEKRWRCCFFQPLQKKNVQPTTLSLPHWKPNLLDLLLAQHFESGLYIRETKEWLSRVHLLSHLLDLSNSRSLWDTSHMKLPKSWSLWQTSDDFYETIKPLSVHCLLLVVIFLFFHLFHPLLDDLKTRNPRLHPTKTHPPASENAPVLQHGLLIGT